MSSFFASRYKNLIISLGVFLLLMTALLGLNYYATRQVAHNAGIIDGIGELSDELYNINLHTQKLQIVQTPQEKQAAVNAVTTSRYIIDKYVELFKEGGDYHYDDGSKMFIPKLTDEADVQDYQKLSDWWLDYKQKLDGINAGGDVAPVANHVYESKDFLYQLVNNIWTNQFDKTEHWNKYAKFTLLAGIILGFLYIAWFIFYFLKKASQSDGDLQIARRQTANILGTVQEGLFLTDKNFVVSEAYSKSLEAILHRYDIAGKTLLDLLKDMVTKDDLEETKLFIEQLYNPWIVPELIEDLNPLQKVRVGFLNEDGEPIVKYLSFKFLRVQEDEDDEVEQVFVNVMDVTDSALLEKTLESEKAQHNRQIEMIGHILNVDARLLNRFIASTYERIDEMNGILRNEGQLHNKAQTLLRKMHALKGEASAISMSSFVKLAERGETELVILRKQSTVSGQDFLGFAVVLNDLLDLNTFVEKLLGRLAQVVQVQSQTEQAYNDESHEGVTRQDEMMTTGISEKTPSIQTQADTSTAETSWAAYFGNHAEQVAERQGKYVTLNVMGFDDIAMSEQTAKFCQDVGIQLLKNAIVHGIELPDERRKAGKNHVGQITLMLSNYGSQLRMSILDDGAGVNVDALRQKAVELGIATADAMAGVPDEKLYPLIFRSGLSTASVTTEDAGRGVGMDVVREWVKNTDGKVQVDSKRGANTKITINFNPV